MNLVETFPAHRVVVSISPTSIWLNLSETLLQRDFSHDHVHNFVVFTACEVSDTAASTSSTMLQLAQRVIAAIVIVVVIYADSARISKITLHFLGLETIFMKSLTARGCWNASLSLYHFWSFFDIRLFFHHLCTLGHQNATRLVVAMSCSNHERSQVCIFSLHVDIGTMHT